MKKKIIPLLLAFLCTLTAEALTANMTLHEPTTSASKCTNKPSESKISNPTGYETGHGYVDLGLPSGTKWATCNVGAQSPHEFGGYFAWGETLEREYYEFFDWEYYKYCKGDDSSFTKYCLDRDYGIADGKTELTISDDAARAQWAGSWRMPTNEQWSELVSKCEWVWKPYCGNNGYYVKGPNGRTIFLPAAGMQEDEGNITYNESCRYWSRTLCDWNGCQKAWGFILHPDIVMYSEPFDRCYGLTVRPVKEK